MNKEWSRGGEPLRSREGYSELTEDWRKLFGGYLDPSSLMEPLSGRSEQLFQGALNGMPELSSSWPFLKAVSSCGDGGVLKQVKLTGRQQRSPQPAGASGKNESRKDRQHCVGPTHNTALADSTCPHKTGLLLSQDTEEAKKIHARMITD